MNSEKLKEGVIVVFTVKKWGARAKIATKNIGEDIPSEIVKASQDLLYDKTILKEIRDIKQKAKYILTYNSLSFPVDGLFFLPKHKIEFVNQKFTEYQLEFNEKVNELISKFSRLKSEFRRKYPKYYDIQKHKYPSKSDLKNRFCFNWNFITIELPDKKSGILPPSMYKREVEKFQNLVKQIEEMTINSASEMLLKRIKRLDEQCQNDSINGHTVSGIETFFSRWDDIWSGYIDEGKFKKIVERLRNQMKNVSSDSLKNSEQLREKISEKLETAIEKIENIRDVDIKRRLDI